MAIELNINTKYIRREEGIRQTVPTNLDFTGELTVQDATQVNQPITKGQLDAAIQGIDIPDIDTSEFANLKTDNIFEKNITFTANESQGIQVIAEADGSTIFDVNANNAKFATNPAIEEAKSFETLADNELVTKNILNEHFNANINALRIISETEPDRIAASGSTWYKISFTQDPDDPTKFTDTPAIYMSLGEKGWWDIHGEKLITISAGE